MRSLYLPTALGMITVLAGCVHATDVQQLGPDTFSVGASADHERGGSSGARAEALSAANGYCRAAGKMILVTNIATRSTNAFGAGAADITFRCLSPDDHDLKARPQFQRSPDVVIENRPSS